MMLRLTLGFVFLSTIALADPAANGLCKIEAGAPGLPKANCSFPSCPSGGDCLPPTIDNTSGQITYSEPLIRWQEPCPDASLHGACWEVHLDFSFKVAATDPSGVSAIGAHLGAEVNAKKTFSMYWGNVTQKDGNGKYTISQTLITYVPPGQRLAVSVYELCARDGAGNEGCVEPALKQKMTF